MSQYVETYTQLRARIVHGPIDALPSEQEINSLRALRWMPNTDAEIRALLDLRLFRLVAG